MAIVMNVANGQSMMSLIVRMMNLAIDQSTMDLIQDYYKESLLFVMMMLKMMMMIANQFSNRLILD